MPGAGAIHPICFGSNSAAASLGGKLTFANSPAIDEHSEMTGNVEAEVIELVARERGLPHERVRLSDRLLQDLGMDGNDAVDFFMSLHERFGTDLTHLQEHWSEHFGPGGMSCWNALLIIPLGVVAGLVAAFAHSKFWGVVAGVALFVAWLWIMRRWGPRDRMVPIAVSDVVAAVEMGEWPARMQS